MFFKGGSNSGNHFEVFGYEIFGFHADLDVFPCYYETRFSVYCGHMSPGCEFYPAI